MGKSDIVDRLRSGSHAIETTVLGGVAHDERCLKAADEIERLRLTIAEQASSLGRLRRDQSEVLELQNIYREFAERQGPLDEELQRVLNETLSDLYEA